jgi:hypothetical protein
MTCPKTAVGQPNTQMNVDSNHAVNEIRRPTFWAHHYFPKPLIPPGVAAFIGG